MPEINTDSIKTNKKYKDSVFTTLFNSEESLLELYKVLHPEDTEVTINDIEKITLGNVLLIRRFNDTAMGIRNKLIVLVEQQSTINPNMPVRILIYIVEEYEKIIKKNKDEQKLYSKKIVTLPAPEFYVIYTGDEECSEYLYISDAFPEEYKDNDFLQLKVKVITNSDIHNILGGYIAFVKKAEELRNTDGYTLKEALSEAVQWCKQEDILSGFMEERSEELMSLMLEEWNLEDAIKYNRKDAMEEGLERGRQEGLEHGLERGRQEGMKYGLERGRQEGLEHGRQEGMKSGMVYAYYEMDMNTNEIAKKVQLTEAEVLEIINNMKK